MKNFMFVSPGIIYSLFIYKFIICTYNNYWIAADVKKIGSPLYLVETRETEAQPGTNLTLPLACDKVLLHSNIHRSADS